MSSSSNAFAAALGTGRGALPGSALRDGENTQAARDELDLRVARASSEVTRAESVRLLRGYPDIEDWPAGHAPVLIRDLNNRLGSALADLAIDRHRDWAPEHLHRTGVRWPHPERIVALNKRGKLHLWDCTVHPALDFAFNDKGRTQCGRDIKTGGVAVPRGLWASRPHMRCEACERYADEDHYQEECEETAEDWLPEWAYSWLHSNLNAAIMRALRDPAQPLEEAAVHAVFDAQFHDLLRQTALEVFYEERNLTLQRGLGHQLYRQLSHAVGKRDPFDFTGTKVSEAVLSAPEDLFAAHYDWVTAHPDRSLDECRRRLFERLLAQSPEARR